MINCFKLILHKRWNDQTWEQCTSEQKNTYGRTHLLAWIPPGKDTFKSSGDTTPVVHAVVDALTKRSPNSRYIVDGTYRAFYDEYAVIQFNVLKNRTNITFYNAYTIEE